VLLHKLDTTDDSCLVLPRTLTNRTHRFLCLLRAAQLPSQDCVCSPVLLVQCSHLHRLATSAILVFRGGEPAQRKVCRLACYACSHWGIGSALRSQYCRKSEYLKPRITTYDSSCTSKLIHFECHDCKVQQRFHSSCQQGSKSHRVCLNEAIRTVRQKQSHVESIQCKSASQSHFCLAARLHSARHAQHSHKSTCDARDKAAVAANGALAT